MSTLACRRHARKIYKMLLVRHIQIPVRGILYEIWNGKRRKLPKIREFPPNLNKNSRRYRLKRLCLPKAVSIMSTSAYSVPFLYPYGFGRPHECK
jgi:hypothetical protein